MNIFEGSRRIAIFAAALGSLVSLAVIFQSDPVVKMEFTAYKPNPNLVHTRDPLCFDGKHETENVMYATANGVRVDATVCFMTKAEDIEKALKTKKLPHGNYSYKTIGSYPNLQVQVTNDQGYTTLISDPKQVQRYLAEQEIINSPRFDVGYQQSIRNHFSLSPEEEGRASKRWWIEFGKEVLIGFGYLILGLVIFLIVVITIGWITRGFMGIPNGKDARP